MLTAGLRQHFNRRVTMANLICWKCPSSWRHIWVFSVVALLPHRFDPQRPIYDQCERSVVHLCICGKLTCLFPASEWEDAGWLFHIWLNCLLDYSDWAPRYDHIWPSTVRCYAARPALPFCFRHPTTSTRTPRRWPTGLGLKRSQKPCTCFTSQERSPGSSSHHPNKSPHRELSYSRVVFVCL